MKTFLPWTFAKCKILFALLAFITLSNISFAQSDVCSSPTPISSAFSCTTTSGTLVGRSYTPIASACGSSSGNRNDVWYIFTAQSTNPMITVAGSVANPRFQIYSATSCSGPTASIYCSSSGSETAIGLVAGTQYLLRIYSNSNSSNTFTLCIVDPNDLCALAAPITSGTSCITTSGTLVGSTYTAITSACGNSSGNRNDVWYSFTAQSSLPTITLGGLTQGRFQVYTAASCGGTVTSVFCSTTASEPATGLTIGANYLVRVYSNNNTASTFTICIVDPPPPANDACTGASTINSGASCTYTNGTLTLATASATSTSCGIISSADVWYSYVATSKYPTITLAYAGATHANFRGATPALQLLAGTCGSFTELGCTSGAAASTSLTLTPNGTGLTIGTTYYIRVLTNTNTGTITNNNWDFQLCLTNGVTAAPTVEYGKSYFNMTKGANGGTIEPGDILQLRSTVIVKTNTAFNVSLAASIPVNTTYVPNTLRVLTNEAQLYKQWTDAADGDPGTVTGSTVTINAGTWATQTAGGMIRNTDRPTVFGSQALMVLTYQVQVDAVGFGVPISVGGGTLTYSTGAGATTNVNFPTVTAITYRNTGICSNAIGSNGILSEFGGTFGSAATKDRSASSKVPANYTYAVVTNGAPGDNFYSVSNNTSSGGANYSINPNETVAARRVFNVWDIIGDHTGASDQLAGNLPANDAAHGGTGGGYMVVINAAYRTDTAFLDTVRNLCPNTSYEYSAWFRNICRRCSGDSTGKSPTDAGYVPTGANDSSGVHPNLTFNINGTDYYTTGDILYTGQWIKKGFTYKTGPAETQMIINIRNNAPGGGGNDWAIDDIGVATCSPNLDVNPSDPTLNICYGNVGTLAAVVRSYFPDYTYYVWERSTNSGATFTNTTFSGNGTIIPTYNGTEYEYTAPGPTVISDSFVHGDIYRLRVASSAANIIDPNCSFLATRTVQIYAANCMWLLKANLLGATGNLQNNFATVRWNTANESGNVNFEIEKSTDGVHFTSIGKVKGNADANGNGQYSFDDPKALQATGYYRIKMFEEGNFKYSKIILLSPDKILFEVKNLVNPFTNAISFDVITPADGDIRITVLDNYGRIVKSYTEKAYKGFSSLKVQGLNTLSSGTYALRVEWQNESVVKRIIKLSN